MKLRARSNVQLQVKAKGLNLDLPSMPLANDPGVVVELRRRTGMCWTSRFDSPSANTAEKYKSTAE